MKLPRKVSELIRAHFRRKAVPRRKTISRLRNELEMVGFPLIWCTSASSYFIRVVAVDDAPTFMNETVNEAINVKNEA